MFLMKKNRHNRVNDISTYNDSDENFPEQKILLLLQPPFYENFHVTFFSISSCLPSTTTADSYTFRLRRI